MAITDYFSLLGKTSADGKQVIIITDNDETATQINNAFPEYQLIYLPPKEDEGSQEEENRFLRQAYSCSPQLDIGICFKDTERGENLKEKLKAFPGFTAYGANGMTRERVYIFKELFIDEDYRNLIGGEVGESEAVENILSAKDKKREYEKGSIYNYKRTFESHLEYNNIQGAVKTGYEQIDKKLLDGGLYNRLYLLGADTGAGKTAFVWQMAQKIAKSGTRVLYFSLEMDKDEMIARAISRELAELIHTQNENTLFIKGTTSILYRRWTTDENPKGDFKKEKELVEQAKNNFFEYANNIFLFAEWEDTTPAKIVEKIETHKRIYNDRPVVIIDYLQLIKGDGDDRLKSKKELIDDIINKLKKIAGRFHLPVFVISSLNRESYRDGKVKEYTNAAFKESGDLEYTADVTLMIEYRPCDEGELTRDIKKKAAREGLKLKISQKKNRNYGLNDVNLVFYPVENRFREE